jgi:hypothetical protein
MKAFRFLTILLLVGLFNTGCEKEDFTYKGPLYVEISAIRVIGTTNSFQYFNSRYYTHNRNLAPDLGTNRIQVSLIGPHQTRDMVVNYRVYQTVYYDIFKNRVVVEQPEGEEGTDWHRVTSTAEPGVNYNLAPEGSFVIPAGSSFGYLDVDVLTNSDNTNTTNSKMVFIGLVDSGDLQANIPSSLYMLCFGRRNSTNPRIF